MASLHITAAMEPGGPSLGAMPVEILVRIFSELDIKDALRLAQASRNMHEIYETHSIYILGPILAREFSPLDALLRITSLSRTEFEIPFSPWSNRHIYFAGSLISDDDKFAHLPEIRFKQEHMPQVMDVVKAVSKWESAFPRLRFAELAEERRKLQPHEKERLRHALYTWWRYANSYHQHHEVDDVNGVWARCAKLAPIRASSISTLSTLQLCELLDLWKTIYAAVATQLCPSVSMLLKNEGNSMPAAYLEHRGWGDGRENDMIILNVLRLRPDHLLQLLDYVAVYPTASKSTLTQLVRSYHPTVQDELENLTDTLHQVIGERLNVLPEEVGESVARFLWGRDFPIPFGGILDDDFWMDELRSQLSSDFGDGLIEDDDDGKGSSFDGSENSFFEESEDSSFDEPGDSAF